MPDSLTPADRRDLGRLNSLGWQVQQQVAHLRRNSAKGDEDRDRYGLIRLYARHLLAVAERGQRRYERIRFGADRP